MLVITEICFKYKKLKRRPILSFPPAKRFNETVALDTKEWTSSTWFLHVLDYLTRFSRLCVIKRKCKEVIMKNIF